MCWKEIDASAVFAITCLLAKYLFHSSELTQVSTGTQHLPSSPWNVHCCRVYTTPENQNFLNTAASQIYRCCREQFPSHEKISTSQSFKGPFFQYPKFEECSSSEKILKVFNFNLSVYRSPDFKKCLTLSSLWFITSPYPTLRGQAGKNLPIYFHA